MFLSGAVSFRQKTTFSVGYSSLTLPLQHEIWMIGQEAIFGSGKTPWSPATSMSKEKRVSKTRSRVFSSSLRRGRAAKSSMWMSKPMVAVFSIIEAVTDDPAPWRSAEVSMETRSPVPWTPWSTMKRNSGFRDSLKTAVVRPQSGGSVVSAASSSSSSPSSWSVARVTPCARRRTLGVGVESDAKASVAETSRTRFT